MDSEQELNKKLAEWAGFIDVGRRDKFKLLTGFQYPDGCIYSSLPNFPQSLDACFKWLLPKLSNWRIEYKYYLSGMLYIAKVWAKDGIAREADSIETPALALCKAIDKLIDSEKKDE